MLVKYNHRIINLNQVCFFQKIVRENEGNELHLIEFHLSGIEGFTVDFYFESQERTDVAFEKIVDAYRWQRQVCTLE